MSVTAKKKRDNKHKHVRTVYVAPTNQDFQNILVELESSEPLPDNSNSNNNNDGESSATKRVESIIQSLQSLLMEQRTTTAADRAAVNDIDDLTKAYESFIKRFQDDITVAREKKEREEDEEKNKLATKLKYLSQFMKRKSLLDLDRHAMESLFHNVIHDLHELLKDDSIILRNSNQLLTRLLNGGKSPLKSSSSCDAAFLDLANGNPTPELNVVKAAAAPIYNTIITEETARESDLYERIVYIKKILSRRDISFDESSSSSTTTTTTDPIDDEGVADLRSDLNAMAAILRQKRQGAFAHDKRVKKGFLQKLLSSSQGDNTDGGASMCADPIMVETLVHRGLESIRGQADLESTLTATLFDIIVADESNVGESQRKIDALTKKMEGFDVPRIDYNKKKSRQEEEGESENKQRKKQKKSLSHIVDGPILHRGVAGLIDSFVELISGYNDHVDELFDYIMSKQGVSVGAAAANAIASIVRKVPLPELNRLTRSGILGGRRRSLMEGE